MLCHDGEALAIEIEGDLVQLCEFVDAGMLVLQDGIVQRAFDAGLEDSC